jgi:trimethylamine--corrinoid protein Co-methyltransferase
MEMLVIADEIIRMTRFLMDGLTINETTLALDAVARAKPGAGFLADEHTLDNWRWAQWAPEVINRQRYDPWVEGGSKDMFTRANERARKILEEHEVQTLPEDADVVISDVLSERAAAG